jgi:hypothetical protein
MAAVDYGPTWSDLGTILTAAQTPLATIFWPWLVDTAELPVQSDHRWRLYFSTDHDNGPGGIALAVADQLTGPWTQRGMIYQDRVRGTQTETPAVVYLPERRLWHLYYHNQGVGTNQSTVLATSPNGVDSWTRVGVVVDVRLPDFPGDGHTGYFIPRRLPGGRWVGFHLMGGGDFPHFGQSWSADGVRWQVDPRPLGYNSHLVVSGRRTEMDTGHLIEHRGRLWWVGLLFAFQSGGNVKDSLVAQAPIGADLRTLLAPPHLVFDGRAHDYRSMQAIRDADGRLWMIRHEASSFKLAAGDGNALP